MWAQAFEFLAVLAVAWIITSIINALMERR
jgi:hypothetical protein